MKSIISVLILLSSLGANAQSIISHSEKEYSEALQQNDKKIITIFGATWCGPCRKMKGETWESAEFAAMAKKKGIKVFYFDVDQHPDLKNRNGVSSIPAYSFFSSQTLNENEDAEAKKLRANKVTAKYELKKSEIAKEFDKRIALNKSNAVTLKYLKEAKEKELNKLDEQLKGELSGKADSKFEPMVNYQSKNAILGKMDTFFEDDMGKLKPHSSNEAKEVSNSQRNSLKDVAPAQGETGSSFSSGTNQN
jgi:thiol-disulfide isomerase/thioredoxin